MSVLETLFAAATSRAGAAVAGLTVAVGSAGAAGQLPDLPSAFDNAFGGETVAEQGEDDGDQTTTEDEQGSQDVGGDSQADDQGVAHDVHDVLNGDEDVWPGDEGFGQAVADHARDEETGGAEFGQAVADAASNGRSSAGAENGEQDGDGEQAAGTMADEADDRSDDGADNAEVADEYRPDPPEDAGQPDDAGESDDTPEQANSGRDTAADAPGR